MKTKLILSLLLIYGINVWAQIPSINETKLDPTTQMSMSFNSIIKDLSKKLVKLKEEKEMAATTKKNGEIDASLVNSKEKEIKETENQIKVEKEKSISIKENYEKYYEAKRSLIEKKIDSLKNQHKEAADKMDEAQMNIIEDQIEAEQKNLKIILNEESDKIKKLTYSFFLPTIKREHREEFFIATYNNTTTKTNYINSFAILGNKDGAVVQSEIITDNMSAFRLSFGTVVTATNEPDPATEEQNRAFGQVPVETTQTPKSQEDALKRLINGGGNFYAEMILPLLTTYDGNSTDLITSYTYANLRGAMDIKGFGNDLDTSTGNGCFGINSYLGASSDNKKFNFFVQGNINYNFGSKEFYHNLGLKDAQGFLNGKVIAGVTLLNRFKVSAIVNTFGSDEKLRNGNVIIGVQILPDL